MKPPRRKNYYAEDSIYRTYDCSHYITVFDELFALDQCGCCRGQISVSFLGNFTDYRMWHFMNWQKKKRSKWIWDHFNSYFRPCACVFVCQSGGGLTLCVRGCICFLLQGGFPLDYCFLFAYNYSISITTWPRIIGDESYICGYVCVCLPVCLSVDYIICVYLDDEEKYRRDRKQMKQSTWESIYRMTNERSNEMWTLFINSII